MPLGRPTAVATLSRSADGYWRTGRRSAGSGVPIRIQPGTGLYRSSKFSWLMLVVIVVVFLIVFNWNWARGPVSRIASAQLHRTVRIDGDIRAMCLAKVQTGA